MKQTIKVAVVVGGVHEYTNLPFLYGIMNQYFSKAGITLTWEIFQSGSAPLAKALASGKIHLAVILTDSVIKSIAEGAPLAVVCPFVNNPLKWKFHVNAHSPINIEADMNGNKFAISRFGSGGHLIALAWAHRNKITLQKSDFVEVGDITGAEQALKQDKTIVFPWEGVTIFHLIESGLFKSVHTEESLPQPFCIAGSRHFIGENSETVRTILRIVNHCIIEISNMEEAEAVSLITAAYNRNGDYVREAYQELQWSLKNTFEPGALLNIISMLKTTGAIAENNQITAEKVLMLL